MNNPPTLSDTKRAFYAAHTRPINSIYRRVLEELMVEMHLLGVNATFTYDSIYALGVVTTFDRFMEGYRPEADRDSIFSALCGAVGSDVQTFRRDAEAILAATDGLSPDDLLALFNLSADGSIGGSLRSVLAQLSDRAKFKYSRLFAIGLFSLVEKVAPDWIKDTDKQGELWDKVSVSLVLPLEKLKKDVELYQSNLEKLGQAQLLLAEMTEAERKKREQRAEERAAKAAAQAEAETKAQAAAETPEPTADPSPAESDPSDS